MSIPIPVPRPGALRALALAALLAAAPCAAQDGRPAGVGDEVFVGSEAERYLRLLQVSGDAPLYPWSLRGFSRAEVDRLAPADSGHPWAGRYRYRGGEGGGVGIVRPQARALYNSAFPHGGNDGPLWAGRGVTAAVQAGFSWRSGPVSLTVAPVAFVAQNAEFELMPNGQIGRLVFADGRDPTEIDLPQRFGDGTYAAIDPGQSTLRVDAGPVALGLSTANQGWGPGAEFPLIMGNAGPGYPHGFLGTSRPANVGIGRLHARLSWGVLQQSDYAFYDDHRRRRFASGLVAAFIPRGAPGLEIGGARFFHIPWREDGSIEARDFLRPFQGLLKAGLDADEVGVENQLASAFFRWVMPRSGFELYGELAREDHSVNLRDLLLEPEHSSGYLFGFQKAWKRGGGASLFALRGEVTDARVGPVAMVRIQGPFYKHTGARQGHTQRGQPLGSRVAYGGAGAMLAADWYHRGGRWTLAWTSEQRAERGVYWLNFVEPERAFDVMHTLGVERLFHAGRFEVTAGLGGTWELNRYFADDAFNLGAVLGAQWNP